MIKSFREFGSINEGRRNKIDQLASTLTRDIFTEWVNSWKEGEKDYTNYSEYYDSPLVFYIDATLHFRTDVDGFLILPTTSISELEDVEDVNPQDEEEDDEYEDFDDDSSYPQLVIDFAVNPDMLPRFWHDMYMILCDTVRHELEHLTQGYEDLGNLRPGRPTEDDEMMRGMINSGLLPEYLYLLLPKEIDANLHGLKFESRKRHESMLQSVQRYLKTKGYTDKENEQILKVWRERAAEIPGMPKF